MDLGRLITRAGHALGGLHRRAAAGHDLTPTALGVLGFLADGRSVSHRELGAALGVAPATLSPVVDTLGARGEVTRTRDAVDRRVVRVSITASGRARFAVSSAAVSRAVALQVPRPSADEEAVIRGYLAALLGALAGEPVGTASPEADGGPEPAGVGEIEPGGEGAYPPVEVHGEGHLGRGRVRVVDPDPAEPGG